MGVSLFIWRYFVYRYGDPRDLHVLPHSFPTRRSSDLVNTARGGGVDLNALTPARLEGRIAGAAVDVLEVEPIPPEHPLMQAWRAPGSPIRHKLVVTPHAAFYSPSSLIDLRRKSAQTAALYLREGQEEDDRYYIGGAKPATWPIRRQDRKSTRLNSSH